MKKWKIIFYILFTAAIVLFLPAGKAEAETFTDNGNGIVTVTYNNTDSTRKMKVGVLLPETGYVQNTYNLNYGENTLQIPLTGGNGEYTIRIYRQVEGSSYAIVDVTKITLDLDDEGEVFLYSNVIVDYVITDSVVKRAASLVKNCKTEREVVEKIHKYLLKYYVYDYDKLANIDYLSSISYIPDTNVIFKSKKGICYDFAVVMAAMLRTQGIKCKVVTGYSSAQGLNGYHAWNQIYDSEKDEWYTLDSTYDICMKTAGLSYTIDKNEAEYTSIKYIY